VALPKIEAAFIVAISLLYISIHSFNVGRPPCLTDLK